MCLQGFRVVYVLGDPYNAVLSIFRRGLGEGHYRGVHCMPPADAVRARLADLELFLEAGIDDFGLEDHLNQWLSNTDARYPVMFLKFDALIDCWPRVRRFVGLPDDTPPPTIRARHSNWRSHPEPTQRRLQAIYGRLANHIDELPSLLIQ
jgi:hypothetical protein